MMTKSVQPRNTTKPGQYEWSRIAGMALFFLPLVLTCVIFANVRPAYSSKESVIHRVNQATVPAKQTYIDSVKTLTQETVAAREQYQGGTFRVLARKSHIVRFRCSSCHLDKKVTAINGQELTHGNVKINHGREGNGLSCIDCHHPEDRDFLEDKKGNKIDFDHSYQLCGQCHFRQKRDWLGGAHGKRVTYWAGERVVFNCTTCHNPHSPRFEKRYPATYSLPTD